MNSSRIIFYSLYLLYVITVLSLLYTTSKGDEIIYINQFQNSTLDTIFKGFTFLGEYIVVVFLGIFLLWKNKKFFTITLIAYLVQTFLVQFLKRFLEFQRPLAYFKTAHITPIADTKILLAGSMPSGHTATIFFMALLISIYFQLKSWQVVLLTIVAICVAISRVYLLAHFKEDILVGSIIGIIMAETSLFYNRKINS